MSRYRFIATRRGHYPVRLLCQLVEVPASGYYAQETTLVKVFGVHKCCYGTRRLQVVL